MLSHIFRTTDVALLAISPTIFDIPDFHRKILLLNSRLSDVGRRISEIRFIDEDDLRISKAIDELSRKFSVVIISGAFNAWNNYQLAKIVAELFSVPLNISQEAMEIYTTSVDNFSEKFESTLKEIYLPRRAELLHKKSSYHFGFRFANLVCCDESLQCMDEILEIIHGSLMLGHHFFTRQIVVKVPFEKFAQKIEEIASENGCEHHIMREDGNSHKIIIRHTEIAIVQDCQERMTEFLCNVDGSFEVFA